MWPLSILAPCAVSHIVKLTPLYRLKNIVVSVVQEMSKKLAYMCDICGIEITGCSANAVMQEMATVRLWPPGEYRAGPGQRIDMCLDCYNRFVNLLDGAKMMEVDDG